MKISVMGLGYVGAVSAGCLAKEGHQVIGVDSERNKVDLFNSGQSPIVEKDIGDIIRRAVASGDLRATTDVADAVNNSELSLVCVGTPSQVNGGLDLQFVRRVCEQIGRAIAGKKDFHTVVIRSTMLPGTMRELVIPVLEEHAGSKAGTGFGVCINPEFLREGTAVHDFYHPPKTVIGGSDSRSIGILARLFDKLDAPLIKTDLETAEMVKYSDNAWHALKVGFANEIGNICKALNLDSHKVMDIFCQDTKLNLSPYYLKPGFAFGGSCLPKDVRALTYKARNLDLELPILNAILPSNTLQVERGIKLVMEKGHRKVGVLGFSFKAGTDDLRESPIVELIERLIGKGFDLRLYDRNVSLASLQGANRDYILKHIPHISRLMVDSIDAVLDHAQTLVLGNAAPEFNDIPARASDGQYVIDLVRVSPSRSIPGKYNGICW